MTTRRPLSKRTRFEVFKRDGFRCCYCGQTPPNVLLECDHIVAVANGGSNKMENLITACEGCNRGKAAVPIDLKADSIREKLGQFRAHAAYLAEVEQIRSAQVDAVAKIYADAYEDWSLTPLFKNNSIRHFVDAIGFEETARAMRTAIARFPTKDYSVPKYFCGICWNVIRKRQQGGANAGR